MQRHRLRRFLGRFKFGFEAFAFRFQFNERIANVVFFGKPFDVGLINAIELAFGPRQTLFDARAVCDQSCREFLAFFIIGLDVGRDEIGRGEIGFQPVEHRTFHGIEIIDAAMLARACFLHLRALDALPAFARVFHRHAGAAAAAFQETGENAFGFAGEAGNRDAAVLLDGAGPLEQILIDDAQMRRIDRLPLGARIGARDALAGVRVLDHAHLVPDDAPGIEIVQDQPVMALPGAVDGRGRPIAAARRRHTAGVQTGRDFARGFARDIGFENFAQDDGFIFLDLQFAGLSGHRPVTIGAPAGMAPVADHPGQAAPDLMGEVLQIDRADEAADADLNLVGLAVMHGPQLYAEEGQALPDSGQIFLIAGQAVQRFDEDDIEGFIPRRVQHAHETVAAEDRGAGAGAIMVGGDDVEAVLRRIGAAEFDLVVDGAFVLEFGREARVNGGPHHCPSRVGRGKAATAARR